MRRCIVVAALLLAGCDAPEEPTDVVDRGESTSRVPVRGGEFVMGTDPAEWPALDSAGVRQWAVEAEQPAHPVRLSDFRLDATEVTNADFARFVAAEPRWSRDSLPAAEHNGHYLEHWPTADGPDSTARAEPVRYVTWHAAASYCAWAGGRLPTEAEWEFAARAGASGDAYPWGSAAADSTRARYGADAPVAVRSYAPNPLGLYDLAGNVWEFVDDVWRPTYADSTTPAARDSANDPTSDARRVIRGGSYEGAPVNMRVRFRDSHPAKNAGPHVGFRCAADTS